MCRVQYLYKFCTCCCVALRHTVLFFFVRTIDRLAGLTLRLLLASLAVMIYCRTFIFTAVLCRRQQKHYRVSIHAQDNDNL